MNKRNALTLPTAVLLAAGLTFSCASDAAKPGTRRASSTSTRTAKIDPPTLDDTAPRDFFGLRNVVAYHEGYYSGGAPEGAAGFDSLLGLGVKTVISVDGAAPDLAAAKARGMRSIHLPIGYNGFDEQRRLQLVRATRDAMKDGPVYIHCHHGKHRSAAAAGTVAASLGWATSMQMVERMRVSGTAPSYKGLYACTTGATVLGADVIDAVPADFPEISRPTGFVRGMVQIDETYEHLKAKEKAGWTVPENHPDLVPAAEAGQLADLFRVLADGPRAGRRPSDFTETLRGTAGRARALEEMLAAGEKDAKKLSEQFRIVGASCGDCHAKHRD